ncbi:MAG: DUF512 domain-containing protein [Clostridiales bacterium]|jgi:putative radical SAM enzyme (TIGR03279 family)|nr:DUF512 domain-containing protein [Clostridiales bacterium]
MVRVTDVTENTPAYNAKIEVGDFIVTINGNEINDVLDYMFYIAEEKLDIEILRDGKSEHLNITKGEYDDLGLGFDSFLMDEKKSCHNQCVFCFIDQMPPNMRETLYFKDDDARLSFLHGNYVTLTNLSQHDINRIIKMKLNINVSVHTTNPELRCKMMNNRFAGEKLKYLKQMTDAGIKLNCQIVLCPTLNDGEELDRTLNDLGEMMPNIQSIAVVPVGLSKYRDGLFQLTPFTQETAVKVLDQIEAFQRKFLRKYGTRLVFPADELFLTAKREIPEAEFYEDYPQYENGVGMLRSLKDEFMDALEDAEYNNEKRCLSIATGVAAYELMKDLLDKVIKKWHNLDCKLYAIKNEFFGETITVTGLITGQDLISQLKDKPLGDTLLISSSMLRRDSDVFLDDIRVSDVEKQLGIKVVPIENNGYDLLDAVLGKEY